MGRSSTCCQRKLSRLCGRRLVARRCLDALYPHHSADVLSIYHGVDLVRTPHGKQTCLLRLCCTLQHRNPADVIRGLRAQYVASGTAQEDGATIAEAFNWMAFARNVAQYFKPAPGLSCMLGPMDAAPKVPCYSVQASFPGENLNVLCSRA